MRSWHLGLNQGLGISMFSLVGQMWITLKLWLKTMSKQKLVADCLATIQSFSPQAINPQCAKLAEVSQCSLLTLSPFKKLLIFFQNHTLGMSPRD